MTGAEEAFDLVGRADADREVHTRDYKCQVAETEVGRRVGS